MRLKAMAWCSVLLLLGAPARLLGQDSLAAARQLYAAAEYHDALAMLGTLLAANPIPQERQSIELYRILCLFAIDDVDDAKTALEAMILRHPLYRPSADLVPRRLRSAFSDARQRLLPQIIQEKYVLAKAAYDQGHYQDAIEGFTQTLTALADPEISTQANSRPLSDLRVLAAGFHELAVKAMMPPSAEAAASPAEPLSPVASIPAGTPSKLRIYQVGDEKVTMPVAIKQTLPTFPVTALSQKTGVVEVVIDETGAVQSATMVTSLNPRYNALVLAAAKTWRYQPATVDGVPVKFKKRIQLTLSPDR